MATLQERKTVFREAMEVLMRLREKANRLDDSNEQLWETVEDSNGQTSAADDEQSHFDWTELPTTYKWHAKILAQITATFKELQQQPFSLEDYGRSARAQCNVIDPTAYDEIRTEFCLLPQLNDLQRLQQLTQQQRQLQQQMMLAGESAVAVGVTEDDDVDAASSTDEHDNDDNSTDDVATDDSAAAGQRPNVYMSNMSEYFLCSMTKMAAHSLDSHSRALEHFEQLNGDFADVFRQKDDIKALMKVVTMLFIDGIKSAVELFSAVVVMRRDVQLIDSGLPAKYAAILRHQSPLESSSVIDPVKAEEVMKAWKAEKQQI